jgi:hypothetical protein
MSSAPVTPYPVTFDVDLQLTDRNRTTCFFRIFYALPHALLVGGPSIGAGWLMALVFLAVGRDLLFSFGDFSPLGGGGVGGAAGTMAFVSWFAIILWRTHPRGLWDFAHFYLRWRSKVLAYAGLLRDEYPPFGDGDYPVRFSIGEKPADDSRDRWSVGLRIIYAIPHFIILAFLGIAWVITAIIAWFSILFTGSYPEGFYRFAIGYMRWSLRVEAYMLLLHDQYPPFSLD